jgi:morphogenetic protein associated with SpoVID
MNAGMPQMQQNMMMQQPNQMPMGGQRPGGFPQQQQQQFNQGGMPGGQFGGQQQPSFAMPTPMQGGMPGGGYHGNQRGGAQGQNQYQGNQQYRAKPQMGGHQGMNTGGF